MRFRVEVRQIKREGEDLDSLIRWIARSFGLASDRGNNTCLNILKELLLEFKRKGFVTSQELAQSLNLSREIVNYHLRTLMACGLIYRERNRYYLRGRTLRESIEELERDIERILINIKDIAESIDKILGLY